MKKEELEKLGLTKEQIDNVLDMHHAEIDPVNRDLQKAQDDLKVAQDKVKTTEAALKKFDGVDAEALNKQIADLQADLKKKDDEHAEALAARDFNDLVKESIRSANGRNEKAIMALLDVETLKASKNQKDDVNAALKVLAEAEDSKMLFGEPEARFLKKGNAIGEIKKNFAEEAAGSLKDALKEQYEG